MKRVTLWILLSLTLTSLNAGWDDVESDIQMMQESEDTATKAKESNSRYKNSPANTPSYNSRPRTTPQPSYKTYTPYSAKQTRFNGNRRTSGWGARYGSGAGSYTWVWDKSDYPSAADSTDVYTTSDLGVILYLFGGMWELEFGSGGFTYLNGTTRNYNYIDYTLNIGRDVTYDPASRNNIYLILSIEILFIDYSDITGTGTYTDNSLTPEGRFKLGLGYAFHLTKNLDLFTDYVYAVSPSGVTVTTDYTYSSGYVGTSYNDVFHTDSRFSFGLSYFFTK